MARMETAKRNKMNKKFTEAVDVINDLLKYGKHRGECKFTMPGGGCIEHYNAHQRRDKRAVKFMVNNGFIPGSKV